MDGGVGKWKAVTPPAMSASLTVRSSKSGLASIDDSEEKEMHARTPRHSASLLPKRKAVNELKDGRSKSCRDLCRENERSGDKGYSLQ